MRLHEAAALGWALAAGRAQQRCAEPSRAEPPRPVPAPRDRTKGSCGSTPPDSSISGYFLATLDLQHLVTPPPAVETPHRKNGPY